MPGVRTELEAVSEIVGSGLRQAVLVSETRKYGLRIIW